MLFFQSFKADPSFLFLYPIAQDTLVQLMLINIRVGPGLSKPWAFGILGFGILGADKGTVVRRVLG